jgi:hypothetical protein
MATVAFQQVSNNFAQQNAKRALEKSISIKFIREYIELALYLHLVERCPNCLVKTG